MKVVLLFDAIALDPSASADERGVLESVDAVEKVVCDVGHAAARVPVADGIGWIDSLRTAGGDVVFNLCEGVLGDTSREALVVAALELGGFRYTGASSQCLALAHRKD